MIKNGTPSKLITHYMAKHYKSLSLSLINNQIRQIIALAFLASHIELSILPINVKHSHKCICSRPGIAQS